MTYQRLEEIATHALHYLQEGLYQLDDFLENYDLELDEDEIIYFGLDHLESEDWQYE